MKLSKFVCHCTCSQISLICELRTLLTSLRKEPTKFVMNRVTSLLRTGQYDILKAFSDCEGPAIVTKIRGLLKSEIRDDYLLLAFQAVFIDPIVCEEAIREDDMLIGIPLFRALVKTGKKEMIDPNLIEKIANLSIKGMVREKTTMNYDEKEVLGHNEQSKNTERTICSDVIEGEVKAYGKITFEEKNSSVEFTNGKIYNEKLESIPCESTVRKINNTNTDDSSEVGSINNGKKFSDGENLLLNKNEGHKEENKKEFLIINTEILNEEKTINESKKTSRSTIDCKLKDSNDAAAKTENLTIPEILNDDKKTKENFTKPGNKTIIFPDVCENSKDGTVICSKCGFINIVNEQIKVENINCKHKTESSCGENCKKIENNDGKKESGDIFLAPEANKEKITEGKEKTDQGENVLLNASAKMPQPPKRKILPPTKKVVKKSNTDAFKNPNHVQIRLSRVEIGSSVFKQISTVGLENKFSNDDFSVFIRDVRVRTPRKIVITPIFESKKNNAINIALGRVKISDEELRDSILNMEMSDENIALRLLESFPTDVELKNLALRQQGFGRAETFFKVITDPLMLKHCLVSLCFIHAMRSQGVTEIICKMETFIDTITTSVAFKEFVSLLLFVANVLGGPIEAFSLNDIGSFNTLKGVVKCENKNKTVANSELVNSDIENTNKFDELSHADKKSACDQKNKHDILNQNQSITALTLVLSKMTLKHDLWTDLSLTHTIRNFSIEAVEEEINGLYALYSRVSVIEEKTANAMKEYETIKGDFTKFKEKWKKYEEFVGGKVETTFYDSMETVIGLL